MRDVPASITAAWESGEFIGDQRPIARVTVQHPQMSLHQSTHPRARQVKATSPSGTPIISTPSTRKTTTQEYASFLFGDRQGYPKELQNIKRVAWQRGVDVDVAHCEIEVWNTEPLPPGATPLDDLDQPGYYTYNYGGTKYSGRWGHTPNEWSRMLMPDNLVRTYEGYGWTEDVAPEKDGKLVLTGVWKIIDVDLTTSDKVIKLILEDVGCLLKEHIAFPPVVPWDFYPLEFGPIPSPEPVWHTKINVASGQRVPATLVKTSNYPWTPPGTGPLNGHASEHALDGNPATYWLSVGNAHPSRGFAYEYFEVGVGGVTLEEVRFTPAGANYTAYLSVSTDGGATWMGSTVIGWRSEGIGRNGGDIAFVASQPCNRGEVEYSFRVDPIPGVTNVRITLGNLQDFGFGTNRYRGGFREISVYSQMRTEQQWLEYVPFMPDDAQAGAYPGIYNDYTDIVKLLCVWAGLYWPEAAIMRNSDGTTTLYGPDEPDPVLAADGRAWGDFENTGTQGPANIGISFWDKKTLLECVAYVRDLTGFIFMVDETGGAVWRLPNLYEVGNWVNTLSENPRRSSSLVNIDEEHTLMDLRNKISGKNVRERVFVGNSTATLGAVSSGWNPNPTGLRRVGGWTDGHFVDPREVQLMADFITLRQMFTYRRDSVVIPANPAIQPDDQVQIFERLTSEGYVHYVSNVASDNDMSGSGQWTYRLDTHWLGEDPLERWAFDRELLSAETRRYLTAMRFGVPPSQTDVVQPRGGA